MPKITPLFEFHNKFAQLTEFAGFTMPLLYTSISEEHLAVRNSVGLFDISHMGRISITGPDAAKLLEFLVPTHVSQQPVGKAFYTLLLNENGGIIDDLIVMKKGMNEYLLVVNAANTEKDLVHMTENSKDYNLTIKDITSQSAMLALQGPYAERVLQEFVTLDLNVLGRFRCIDTHIMNYEVTVSRTGYTGEDGFEIIMYGASIENTGGVMEFWKKLTEKAKPCGLGARDTLRLEAGYPLYGFDISESINPFEADLTWVISKNKREYLGAQKLACIQEVSKIRRGLLLDVGIPRHGYEVISTEGDNIGAVTSGTFSPLLRKGIGMCYIAKEFSQPSTTVFVKLRGLKAVARVVRPPFYDERLYGWKRAR